MMSLNIIEDVIRSEFFRSKLDTIVADGTLVSQFTLGMRYLKFVCGYS